MTTGPLTAEQMAQLAGLSVPQLEAEVRAAQERPARRAPNRAQRRSMAKASAKHRRRT